MSETLELELRKLYSVWSRGDTFQCLQDESAYGIIFLSARTQDADTYADMMIYKLCLVRPDSEDRIDYSMPRKAGPNPRDPAGRPITTKHCFNKKQFFAEPDLQTFVYESTQPNPVCIKANKAILVPNAKAIILLNKVLERDTFQDREYFERFLCLLELNTFLDFGVIVMPFINGYWTFKDIFNNKETKTIVKTNLLLNAFVALLRLLLIGVYHLDFKNDNMMARVFSDDSSSICILDFGISQTHYQLGIKHKFEGSLSKRYMKEFGKDDFIDDNFMKPIVESDLFTNNQFYQIIARYFRLEMLRSTHREKWSYPQSCSMMNYFYGSDKFEILTRQGHTDEKRQFWMEINNPTEPYFSPLEIESMNQKRDIILSLLSENAVDHNVAPLKENSEEIEHLIDSAEADRTISCRIMGGFHHHTMKKNKKKRKKKNLKRKLKQTKRKRKQKQKQKI